MKSTARGAAPFALLLAAALGCSQADNAHEAKIDVGQVGQVGRAQGPDSASGFGTRTINPTPPPTQAGTLPDDWGINNSGLIMNIGAVGMDASSSVLDGPFSRGIPISNIPAPSGGNLIDIATIPETNNDQFVTNAMSVVGASSIATGRVSFRPPDNLVFWFEVLPDTATETALINQMFDGASNVRRLVTRGVILNNLAGTRGGVGQAIGGTTTESAGTAKALISGAFAGAVPQSFRDNVPDAFPILVHTLGGGGGFGQGNTSTHVPVFVIQVWSLAVSIRSIESLTIIQQILPGGGGPTGVDTLFIGSAAELVLCQANRTEIGLDVLPSGPMFVPNPGAASGFPNPPPFSLQTSAFNAGLRAAGPPASLFALTGDNFGAGTVQWVSYIGRDEPQVSYTYFDPGVGAMVFQRDPALPLVGVHVQLRPLTTITPDDPGTATVDEALTGRLTWLRAIAVSNRNDSASSSDLAISALRSFPATPTLGAPRSITTTFFLSGRVENAPPGTVITVAERQPTFFNFFNPITQSPLGPTLTSGFFGPGSGPGLTTLALTVPVLRATVRPFENGNYILTLPAGFFVQIATGTAIEAVSSTYVVTALMPGGAAPVQLGTVSAERLINNPLPLELGTTDLSAQSDWGTLTFRIEDQSQPGVAIPGQLTLLNANGTPVAADLGVPTGLEIPWDRAFLSGNIAMTASGLSSIPLKAGTYDLLASAGIEWETDREPAFTIVAGQESTLTFLLSKVTNVTNTALSADFHVHSGQSLDSSLPGEDRVRSFLAQGIQVLAQTEHDKVGDLSGAIAMVAKERGDIANRLKVMAGEEFTTDSGWLTSPIPGVPPQCVGHWNGYPLPQQIGFRKGGAPEDEFKAPVVGQLSMRLQDGILVQPNGKFNEIIQMNHPRASTTTGGIDGGDGFMSNLSFAFGPVFGSNSAVSPITALGIQTLVDGTQFANPLGPTLSAILMGSANFDVYEVMIGGQDTIRYLQNRADWFAFLNRGVIKTASGDSDSHRIDDRAQLGLLVGSPAAFSPRFDNSHVGVPRNYLLISDTPSTVTDGAIVIAMQPTFAVPTAVPATANLNPAAYVGDGMKSFATTGPFMDVAVTLDGVAVTGPIGRFVDATGPGAVSVTVNLTGPTWIMSEVTQARIVVNGVENPQTLVGGSGPKSATFGVVLTAGQDTWIVVEAGGTKTGDSIPLPPALTTYGQVYPGTIVISYTNPIFFNRDATPTSFDAVAN